MNRKIFLVFTVAALAMLMLNCTTTKYVPVERVSLRTDTVSIVNQRVDTVLNSDTVRIYQRGDTVFAELVKWRVRVRERHDTLYRAAEVRDSVPYPVEVEKFVEVERQRAWWETALNWIGGIALISLFGGAIWRYLRATRH